MRHNTNKDHAIDTKQGTKKLITLYTKSECYIVSILGQIPKESREELGQHHSDPTATYHQASTFENENARINTSFHALCSHRHCIREQDIRCSVSWIKFEYFSSGM